MGHHDLVNDTDPPVVLPPGTPEPISPVDEPARAAEPSQVAEPTQAVASEHAGMAESTAGPTSSEEPTQGAEPAPATEPATAAEPPASSGGVHRQNRIALVGTVTLIVALAIGAGYLLGRGTSTADGGAVAGIGGSPSAGATPGSSAPVPTPATSTGPALPSDGNRLGNADAKIVIDYWADYQCPFCQKFAAETIPLLTPYIADGTVALVHRDYAFIGPESIDAAIAVRCAGRDGKYWPMHDAVYAAQNGENKGAFARDRLAVIGASVGLDSGKLDACFSDRSLLAEVLADTAAGVRTAIESTPTLDVNGTRFLGVPKFDDVKKAIDAAVAGATPAPLPTQAPVSDPWAGTPTDGRTAGGAAAPVTVALWMDYQAANSAAVTKDLGAELRTRIANGKVRLELHDLALLGDESVTAGVALRCVDAQGGPTWLIADVLSVSAQGKDAGIYTPENLLRLASQLGLDVAAFNACLSDPSIAQAVRDETAAGKAAGLAEGPAIVISAGGKETARFSGTLDAAKVLAAVDAAK
jgi:protein-disulfide isomerase